MNYIYVTYGTQTGNSEAIASRISKELKENFNKDNKLMVLNTFLNDIQKFPESKNNTYYIIVVCSTTGNGDAPANSDKFIRWIKRKTHPVDILSNMKFAVLGLGDSNYTKYQFIPRLVDEYFTKLGAQKFYKRGEADDAYGLEAVVEPWIEGLYKELENVLTSVENNPNKDDINIDIGPINENYSNGKIISRSRLSGKNADKEIISLKIEFTGRGSNEYTPGSIIGIIPDNSNWENYLNTLDVKEKFLQIDKTHNFMVYSDFFEKYTYFKQFLFKGFLSLEEIFKYIIDFESIMNKSQVDNLKTLLKSKIHKIDLLNQFEFLLSKYTDLIVKNKICLKDIFNIMEIYKLSINISLLEILNFFPIKRPRSYSLVSNSKTDKNLEIVFSLVKEKVNRKFPKELDSKCFPKGDYIYNGVCSNFLKSIEIGQDILLTPISNHFEFPNDKPIVYICNGTGITPCINYLKELKHICEKKILQNTKLSIFTGFRSANENKSETIYEDFITKTIYHLNNKLGNDTIKYHRCLSISSENEEEEVGIWRNCRLNSYYVQDLILEHQEEFYDILFVKNGYLMICGDVAKLYDECIENILYILFCRNQYPREYSLKLIEDMRNSNRIIIEKWI